MKKLCILCATFVFATLALQVALFAGDHAAVGSDKCKGCHKVQFDSWSKSKHALAKEPTTCETCHGNGADYGTMKSLAIMKDPVKAKEAGLIAKPDKATCTAKCHSAEHPPATITDEILAKVHDHKVKK